MPSLGGWELVILIGLLVLVFGARKLPDMARSVGQSARVFKGEMKGLKVEGPASAAAQPAPAEKAPEALGAPAPVMADAVASAQSDRVAVDR